MESMSSHLIPKTVLEIMGPSTMGESVHQQDSGSLRLKNLETQNHCLLMKFLHKPHDPAPLPWNESLVQAT
jgi:hypothetical protein